MHPVIFSVGSFTVSSFGLFMALAFLAAVLVVWRVGRIYDIDDEKILDLTLLTFLGGLLGARVYFVVTNWGAFGDLAHAVLVNRYPGLSFWGGLVGGFLFLKFFVSRTKIPFWQIADFAAVGLLIGLVVGDIGCFLGGCGYGAVSDLPVAFPVIGLLGKRFPVSLLESLLLFLVFLNLWGQVIRFHFLGKVTGLSLIMLGVVKFATEFLRGDSKFLGNSSYSYGHLFSAALVVLGVIVFYLQSRRNFLIDLKSLSGIFISSTGRKSLLLHLKKSWYNQLINWKVKMNRAAGKLGSTTKALKRKLNVKSTPSDLRES